MSDVNENTKATITDELSENQQAAPALEAKQEKQDKQDQDKATAFTLVRQDNGVAHLIMDVVGDSMNTLKAEFSQQVADVLQQIREDSKITALVLLSGKADSFVVGADINMLDQCESAEQATALSRQGQMILDQLARLPIPVVAAIDGPCLGGGLELAMACHARVASDSVKTALGLPEVQLGLLPGGGGTQRLPQLVGIQKALDMMLTGKQLRAKQALKAGLVSDVVPSSILVATAEKLALSGKLKSTPRKSSLIDKLLEGNSLGRKLVFSQAAKTVLAKTRGKYPAPLKIIDCVRNGIDHSPAQGYQVEADHFGELVMSAESTQLRNLFFATTEMKKQQGVDNVQPEKINKVGILGGGLMGGGIAFVTATKAKVPARIKDISEQGISNALKYSYDILAKKVKRRFLNKSEQQKQLSQITGSLDYSGFEQVDLVIEAVFEDLSLKQQMLAQVEQHCKTSTIFASNTSSLPIGKIAENAARPENVIGLHYFSPVDKMPLVEVIAHATTSDQTISSTVAFAKKQGKTPIVVKDKAGFYVNRILAPYMNEAAMLVLAGESIDKIDQALVDFGLPVGPLMLLDEVGIDVGAKISPILQAELGERFAAPPAFDKLLADGRLGKKSKKGFYLYNTQGGSNKKQVDKTIYSLLNVKPQDKLSAHNIALRCIYLMLNEAVACLDEGVIATARDGDIGAIFGIGFPPFLGGPLRYLDQVGAQHVVAQLSQWSAEHGERFTPCDALVNMAEQGVTCY
jgi:3-hydroxyacyl-CoA dehydrogenase/enoyl-CoA hydratase/3-hydroxybutyryl-CoA epimerase